MKSKVTERTMYLYMRLSAKNLSSGNFSQVSPTACTNPWSKVCCANSA